MKTKRCLVLKDTCFLFGMLVNGVTTKTWEQADCYCKRNNSVLVQTAEQEVLKHIDTSIFLNATTFWTGAVPVRSWKWIKGW